MAGRGGGQGSKVKLKGKTGLSGKKRREGGGKVTLGATILVYAIHQVVTTCLHSMIKTTT